MTKNEIKCPKCGNADQASIVMVEYWGGLPYHYDGVSEFRCQKCESRWGRWTGTLLAENEVESPFGKKGHLVIK